jgi:hypothetical protein
MKAFLVAFPAGVKALLDWLVMVAERLIVLGLCSAIFYVGYRFLSGRATTEDKELVTAASNNWKTVLLILIPLFYQTVRVFLEEVQEAFGMKRRQRQLPGVEAPAAEDAKPTPTPQEEE